MIRYILGIDPGPTQSAYVLWDSMSEEIKDMGQHPNDIFRTAVLNLQYSEIVDVCVIEDMAFYGKIMNRESFETLKYIGRLQEIFNKSHELVYFPDIAMHFCNSRSGVKTSNINAVLVDRFGGKGTAKRPGKLYGVKEHIWSALAVAVFFADMQQHAL